MAKCHFDQANASVPVAVITSLKVKEPEDIIFNNYYDLSDTEGSWVLEGARVMITRFWASSSATIILVPNLPSGNSIPKKLPKSIGLEKEFCLWMGYIEQLRPVKLEDLTSGKLLRVFTGVIENIKDTSSAKGITLMLQARDRVKWLMDSSIFFSAEELIVAGDGNNNKGRSDLILAIANYSIGGNPDDKPDYTPTANGTLSTDSLGLTGKSFRMPKDDNAKYVVDPGKTGGNVMIGANEWYKKDGPLSAKLLSDAEIFDNPEFRIVTTRNPLIDDAENVQAINFVLAGQMPLETLKQLAFQEVFPMEIFQSQYDGNVYYAPRGNDSGSLSDPERFYRQYFFKVEEDLNVNQKLIALRTEMSSIGLKTNFLINRAAANQAESNDDYLIHLMTKPPTIDYPYAAKFHKISDPTIEDGTDAALVAISMASIWGREVEAAMTVMIGDPSITPGEIFQVYGNPNTAHLGKGEDANDERIFRERFLAEEKAIFLAYDTAWDTYLKEKQATPNLKDIKTLAKQEEEATNAKDELVGRQQSAKATYTQDEGELNDTTNPPSDERRKELEDRIDKQKKYETDLGVKIQEKQKEIDDLKKNQEDPKSVTLPANATPEEKNKAVIESVNNSILGPTFVFEKGSDTEASLAEMLTDKEKIAKLYQNRKDVEGNQVLGTDPKPASIFRVEAVVHKYNLGSKGFISEVALIPPF